MNVQLQRYYIESTNTIVHRVCCRKESGKRSFYFKPAAKAVVTTVFVSAVCHLVFDQAGSIDHDGHQVDPEEYGPSVAVQGTADLIKNRKGLAIIFHNH